MNKYRKGYRLERELTNQCRKQGWVAYGSRGSHSPIDVTAWNPKTMRSRIFQCKNTEMTQRQADKLAVKIKKESGLHTVFGKVEFYLVCKIKEEGVKWVAI